jgi:mRNA interferase MazF
VRRGDVWWAALGPPAGSAPGYRRPVLILQTNVFNDSRLSTVVVAAITSNLRLAGAPGNVRCRRQETGLGKPSVINVSQLATVDKDRLQEIVGQVGGRVMRRVEDGVRLVLGL